MKAKMLFPVLVLLMVAVCGVAENVRVAVVDFENETELGAMRGLPESISSEALSQKGVLALADGLIGQPDVELIDRRAFFRELDDLADMDAGALSRRRPGILKAAQALNADVVLRGSLISASTGGRNVNQGGYKASFTRLSIRVVIEAIDAVSGSILSISEGVAKKDFRQTDAVQTVVSEDDLYDLLKTAVQDAIPELREEVAVWMNRQHERDTVLVSIRTTDDPALVEIDGLLVGTTPLERYQVTAGDHLLTIGKAGYRDVEKRMLFDRDIAIEVPMIRTELSAEEVKEVLESIRMDMVIGEPGLIIRTLERVR